jgi:hypothetical protein
MEKMKDLYTFMDSRLSILQGFDGPELDDLRMLESGRPSEPRDVLQVVQREEPDRTRARRRKT